MNEEAQTRTTAARYVGDWPKIGIRPGHRRSPARASASRSKSRRWRWRRRRRTLLSANLRYPDGQPVECVDRRYLHRRRGRSGQAAEKFRREGVGVSTHGHPVLVLRLRDDGHGPAHAQGGVGLQRHRAAGRRLPGGGAGRRTTRRACRPSASTATTCRTPATPTIPRRRAGEAAALRPGRPGRRDHARQVVPVARRRLDGHRRLDRRPRLLRALPRACASRAST